MNAHLQKEIALWEPMPMQLDHTSTYSAHFQKWPLPPRKKATKPSDTRPPTAGRFDTRSTMQDSFQHFSGNHMPRSCRPSSAYTPQTWMQPISTTHRDAFMQWPIVKKQSFRPKQARTEVDNTPTGRSTMQDSYQPFMNFVPTTSAQPVEKRLESTPFEGTTTSRASFLAWPIPPRHQRTKTADMKWDGAGDKHQLPQSTYRDMFREIVIPRGSQSALGLQVVGGKFHMMINRGTIPPVTKKVTMTTTIDKQSSMDIVVVLTSDDTKRKGRVLGEFELDGIAPAKAGIPQVEIMFNLSNDNSLRVSALDKQGNRARALTVKDKVRLG
jgi:hypothetical protein